MAPSCGLHRGPDSATLICSPLHGYLPSSVYPIKGKHVEMRLQMLINCELLTMWSKGMDFLREYRKITSCLQTRLQ